MKNKIYIIGYMGTGKTTVSRKLGAALCYPVTDMDEVISEKFGMSISDIFETHGEKAFRLAETALLKDIASSHEALIVSCGGGLPLKDENISLLKKSGKTILLTASPKEILKRLEADESRPLLKDKKDIKTISAMLINRQEAYEKSSDVVIDTDGKTISKIVDEIQHMLDMIKAEV